MYYVYIMGNRAGTPYTSATSDLERRTDEHKNGLTPGFTSRYKVVWLVYYEATDDVTAAIEPEKQIKGWIRRKKVELIESMNPLWVDLSDEWFREEPDPSLRSG